MTPQQQRAYRLVKSAINRGDLIRPDNCSRCGKYPPLGSDGRSCIQAHHHDYSKPLDVEWICSVCHRLETPLPSKPGGKSFGEANGQSKLTVTDVVSAKRLRSSGNTYQSIADRFGVDKRTIMRAIKGEQWKQLASSIGDAK